MIEDDFALAASLVALLQASGFDASHAADGEAGLAMARKENPELVLLDVLLPGLDGFDVCRRLRSQAETAGAKVIMLTGLGKVGDVDKAFSCGACDYLIKPFDSDRLLKKIRKVLGLDPAA